MNLHASRSTLLLPALVALLASAPARAATPPCLPCGGVVGEADVLISALAEGPEVADEQRLYVAWNAELDGTADPDTTSRIADVGGTPWAILALRTPASVKEHLDELTAEIEEIARLARTDAERAHFQLDWIPTGTHLAEPADYAFVVKRAAVAVTGADPEARVIVGPLPPNGEWIRAFYAEGVAAYVDGIALPPLDESQLAGPIGVLREVDPGKPIVVAARSWPAPASAVLAGAAADAALGVSLTLFEAPDEPGPGALAPLQILAREFSGDLSLDPTSAPSAPGRTWSFVRGEDLGLRVIAESDDSPQLSLYFPDPQLKAPARIDLSTGEDRAIFGQSRSSSGLVVPIDEPDPVVVLRLERMTAAELEGVDEEVLVADERQLPVEEILRRLQAFEDDQARRLEHYRANNRTNLRFRIGNGAAAVDVAYEGDFFYREGEGFDWAWEELYFNGVKWKGERLPEIPLVQPEKAAALPLQIYLSKQYRYRLRGTETIRGRDCWIVDFEPNREIEGETFWQGTVWIDRETSARVRTKALQLGLEGDVLSNEETFDYSPVDPTGRPTEWSRDAFVLPLRMTGQQLLSLLNTSTLVEREMNLTDLSINDDEFENVRRAALESDVTMVRDTDEGLRYLVKDEDGERIVKKDFDADRIAIAGGFFYDDSADFPVPLFGINYFSLDWRDTGNQLNFLFAGPLLVANLADPDFLGSRWDAGMAAFGFFLPLEDDLYRNGVEIPEEAVESANASLSFFLGHPIGNYTKLDLTAGISYRTFGEADDTRADFVIPQDHATFSLSPELTYTRSGWHLPVAGGYFQRSDWEAWGVPGSGDFDPEHEDYVRWQASVAKTWWLPKFTQFGFELEHLDGSDLDRFSKWDFGLFGGADVAGYPSGLVRAEEADGAHLSYGVNLGEFMQVELEADAVWASDEATGLEDELLAGIGLEGTLIGPWETLVNFEIGHAVDGPSDGYSARVTFLKLFPEGFKLFKRKRDRSSDE